MDEVTLEERLRRVDESVEQARRSAEIAARIQEQLEGLVVTGTSRRREVEVEVDTAGRLQKITFLPASSYLAASGLSRVVMEAMADARQQAADSVREVVEDVAGRESALSKQMLAAYEQAGGTAPSQRRTRPKPDHHPGLIFPSEGWPGR